MKKQSLTKICLLNYIVCPLIFGIEIWLIAFRGINAMIIPLTLLMHSIILPIIIYYFSE